MSDAGSRDVEQREDGLDGLNDEVASSLGPEESARSEIARLRSLLSECRESSGRIEDQLQARLRTAEERIAFLEEEPTLPADAPLAPSWVRGRLRRAVARSYSAFEALEGLQESIERYQDALMIARSTLDDLRAFSVPGAPVGGRLELLDNTEEALAELVDSSVDVESLQHLSNAVLDARTEIDLALDQSEMSPLKLGPRLR